RSSTLKRRKTAARTLMLLRKRKLNKQSNRKTLRQSQVVNRSLQAQIGVSTWLALRFLMAH
ncbi:asmA family protein, partial [Vibrio parahaemolyticus V-223/04]